MKPGVQIVVEHDLHRCLCSLDRPREGDRGQINILDALNDSLGQVTLEAGSVSNQQAEILVESEILTHLLV